MKDVQNESSGSDLDINKVGIKELSIPLIISDKENKTQNTIARINMYVNLPKEYKGTHMSRFLEVIYKHTDRAISIKDVGLILKEIKGVLNAQEVHLDMEFPFFLNKEAPVSKKKSLLNYNCKFLCTLSDDKKETKLVVEVPVTTLCPCSKEISRFGAHNQRGLVSLQVILDEFLWIEDLIRLVERKASSEIYPLLKREDEAYVTEKAYQNPGFVEDIVRGIAKELKKEGKISGFSVECENFESIHNHSAYAYIEENLR